MLCACIRDVVDDIPGFLLSIVLLLSRSRKEGYYNAAYECHCYEYYSSMSAVLRYESFELSEINHGLDE